MDGGEREREGAARIKHVVKEALSRKAALQASVRRQKRKRGHDHGYGHGVAEDVSSNSLLGERKSPDVHDGDLDDRMPGLTPDVSPQSAQSPETTTVIPPAASSRKPKEATRPGPSTIHDIANLNLPSPEEEQEGRSTPPTILADRRVRLSMHFLDHVFTIEFPFHNRSIFSGGRGWLLSLLIRTRPLYHAVLSVNAYTTLY